MKRRTSLIVIFGVVVISVLYSITAYSQDSEAPRLTVTGQTHLATQQGRVGIGTDAPRSNIDVVETGGANHADRPVIQMQDIDAAAGGSGYTASWQISTITGGDTVCQFGFPATNTEPASGLFLRVDDDQNCRFYGDVVVYGNAGNPPLRDNIRFIAGIPLTDIGPAADQISDTAPDTTSNGLMYGHDMYLRAVGGWLSEVNPLSLHMAQMVRAQSSQHISSGSNPTRINFDTAPFDYGGIARTADGRFEIANNGIYAVEVSYGVGTLQDYTFVVYIYKGDDRASIAAAKPLSAGSSSGFVMVRCSTVLSLEQNDRLEMRAEAYNSEGGKASFYTETTEVYIPTMTVTQLRGDGPVPNIDTE